MSDTVGIVIQARMGSTRLPGKVLKPLAGKPMLARIIHRLQLCKNASLVIVATSDLAQDDPVAELSEGEGALVFRGSEVDVLDRYYQCAKHFRLDHIVRATGDNPFVDPEEGDRLIAYHLENGFDYSSSFDGGLPVGIGLEIMLFDALEKSWRDGQEAHHREHVNEYILENRNSFSMSSFQSPPEKSAPELSFTIDTDEQFLFADGLILKHQDQNDIEALNTQWLIEHKHV